MYTDEQIQKRAKEIGNRKYHPIPEQRNDSGITIRQELMRTAMGGLCANPSTTSWEVRLASDAQDITNALLIQMAKDELVVNE